jgi:hypothetical protein
MVLEVYSSSILIFQSFESFHDQASLEMLYVMLDFGKIV